MARASSSRSSHSSSGQSPSGQAPIPGLAVRRAALQLLDAIVRRGEALDHALPAYVKKLDKPADRGLVHNIAGHVLRWMGPLDALIDAVTRNRLPDDAKARMVLRIALAQVLLLETPAHAAIATALPLLSGGPRRLVHGVFSNVTKKVQSGDLSLPAIPPLPVETEARWQEMWGEDFILSAQAAWAHPAPLDLQIKNASDQGLSSHDGASSLMPGHVRLPAGSDVTTLPGFSEGAFWVQDLAASLPVRLLGAGEGRTALDLCAAPGGKTMQLAAAGWTVTAVDNAARRMKRLAENLNRTGLDAAQVQADILQWQPDQPVDAIMLDAPCSATGIFRRHPDVLHIVGPHQIVDRVELQAAMLERATLWLKPGGHMVYAVCSLEREEGEDQISAFLNKNAGFSLIAPTEDSLPSGVQPIAQGDLAGAIRTTPAMMADAGGMDGFFIALLQKL